MTYRNMMKSKKIVGLPIVGTIKPIGKISKRLSARTEIV